MSMVNREDIQLLDLALEEGRLCDILEIAQSFEALEPELEERVKEAARQHKEELIDYLNSLRGRKRCRAGFAFSYGVLGLIDNFEQVYNLEGEVEVSKKKSALLNGIKKKNFKNSPEGIDLGFVPKRLTAERDSLFAGDYMLKMQRELVPEIKNLGLGERQIDYVVEQTQILLQNLSMFYY